MQAFKYDLPTPGPKKPSGPRIGLSGPWIVAGAIVLGGAWAWTGMPRGVAAGALGWSLGGSHAVHADAPRADVALAEGEKRLRAGDAAGAASRFDEALRQEPSLVTAYQRGLDARALAGLPVPSLAELLPAPAARVTFLLARSAREGARRPAAALDDCDQALAIAPADPRVLRARVAVLEKGADAKAAIAAYEQALRVLPDDLPLQTGLVQLLFRQGDLDQAIKRTREHLLSAAGGAPDALVHGGLVLAAIEEGLAPDAVQARLASAAPRLGEADRRLFTAQAYLRHFQENANWHRASFDRALEAARSLEDPKLGATPQQRLLADEVVLEALATRAGRLAARGEADAARKVMDEALALRPRLVGHDPRFAARFADLYAQRARLGPEGETAIKAMEAAIALVPDHPVRDELARIDANLGVSLLGAKKIPQAIKPLERAVALAPGDAGVLARYHQALVALDAKGPLDACARASGLAERGELVAALLEGYERNHLPKIARKLYDLTADRLAAPARELARAELLAGDGDRAGARELLQRALKREPSAARWRRLASLDREGAGHLDGEARLAMLQRAREAYLHALAATGDTHDRALALAVAREQVETAMAHHDFKAARAAAEEGLRLDPRNAALGLALATTLAHAGSADAAITACRLGLQGITGDADPMHAPLRERLGSLYRGQKRFAEAVAEYKRGLSEEARPGPALAAELTYGLALAHAGNGDREEALNAIRQYVAISSHDAHQAARVPELQALELDLAAKKGT